MKGHLWRSAGFLLALGILILFGVFAVPIVRRELAALRNQSFFTSDEMNRGREHALQGQKVVKAVRAFNDERGRFPNDPGELSGKIDSKNWLYYLRDSRSFTVYANRFQYLLYFESESGWLMAEDPDTRPVLLISVTE